MFHDFHRYLLPSQLPPEWRPGDAIDLLPALRACYPGCIPAEVLAVQLHRPLYCDTWLFRITRAGASSIERPVLAVTDDGDHYDFRDFGPDDHPMPLIERVLIKDRHQQWQELLGIFTEDAYRMLLRAHEAGRNEDADEMDHLETAYGERVRFFRDLSLMLATHIAKDIDFVPAVVADLKSTPARGYRSTDTTRWDEVMDEVERPSLVHHLLVQEVQDAVWSEFHGLPRAAQVALWFKLHADNEFPGGRHSLQWDPPSSLDTCELFDMDSLFASDAGCVLGIAQDAAHQRDCQCDDDAEAA